MLGLRCSDLVGCVVIIVRRLNCLQTGRLARGKMFIVGCMRCWHDRAGCGCALGDIMFAEGL